VTRRLAILGCTGSIGSSTLAVVREHPQKFRIESLAARERWEPMIALVEEFKPALVALADPVAARALRDRLPPDSAVRVVDGEEGLVARGLRSRVRTPWSPPFPAPPGSCPWSRRSGSAAPWPWRTRRSWSPPEPW